MQLKIAPLETFIDGIEDPVPIVSVLFETARDAPVKVFLEAQGFAVRGEICGCDVVAIRDDEPPPVVIAELKLSFTLDLVLQAVGRLRAADKIHLAGSRTVHPWPQTGVPDPLYRVG